MQSTNLLESDKDFIAKVEDLEKRLFPGRFDETDATRMKNHGKYSWLYRPSHHIKTGLITRDDISLLSEPGKKLLSIGAHPGYVEQLLYVLGIPAENMLMSDKDPGIAFVENAIGRVCFDATGIWPKIGTFDRIIFPESLCMAVGLTDKSANIPEEGVFPSDAKESEYLAVILKQAIERLRPGGIIRANGPMSHPNVVKATSDILKKIGAEHRISYQRYFMTIVKIPKTFELVVL